ncbi:MAG TPA: hypothetical protein P5048_01635 [Chlamydiales bacterium]|nr:hypothetical protein [Chlamydiales bacterium]
MQIFQGLRKYHRRIKQQTQALYYSTVKVSYDEGLLISNNYVPIQLKNVPLADKKGIITEVHTISLDTIPYPYNPSHIATDNTFELFFRYDTPKSEPLENPKLPLITRIGQITLDKNFKPISKPQHIKTNSQQSEDPRIIRYDDKILLFYNDIARCETYCRTMRMAELNSKNYQILYSTELDINLQKMEKNWVPFIIKNANKSVPHIVYQMNPHKILRINSLKENDISHLCFPNNPTLLSKLWPAIWGTPRGGTPALKIDNEYISFFHSAFTDFCTNTRWYVIGAYRFEDKPPYRITAISEHPLIFQGLYDTPHSPSANPKLRCLFASGLTIDTKEDKTVFHVSCGENDSGIKILTIDKDKLYQNMKKISYAEIKDQMIATK